ncbi:MAG TPA: 2'-5' RNA ligase family protein [Streptosporangiaceae bacterium]
MAVEHAGRPATGRAYWRGRPGWHTGQDFYACFLTLEDQPELRGLVRRYQDALGPVPDLDLIAPHWLHITMQGIGFADDISPTDLAAITERIGVRLRAMTPPKATFGRPTIRPTAVYLKADPPEPLYRLRLALHEAVASAVGPGHFGEAAPGPRQFAPHVSLAYARGTGPDPVAPVTAALRDGPRQTVTATFSTASLLVFRRDEHVYGWTSATPLAIGAR